MEAFTRSWKTLDLVLDIGLGLIHIEDTVLIIGVLEERAQQQHVDVEAALLEAEVKHAQHTLLFQADVGRRLLAQLLQVLGVYRTMPMHGAALQQRLGVTVDSDAGNAGGHQLTRLERHCAVAATCRLQSTRLEDLDVDVVEPIGQ